MKHYFKERKEKRKKQAEQRNILSALPDFTNRLVLLLNAGMVVTQAVQKIAREEERDSYFYRQLHEIGRRMQMSNSDFAAEFRNFAGYSGVRELLRLANIITDNMNKGSALVEKLEQEANFMWHMSKKQVEERGRLAESKLSFPMALMLIALVMITAAPALLSFS